MNKYQALEALVKPLFELENKMTEIKNERDAIRADLEGKTREELIQEVVAVREVTPKIIKMMNDLNEFKALANNAEEMTEAIEVMVKNYSGKIALQAREIEEMRIYIDQLQEDPLGVEKRLGKKTKVTIQ